MGSGILQHDGPDQRKGAASRTRTKAIVAAVAVAVASLAGAGIVVAAGSAGDDAAETPITGIELERATEAALAHTGGGRVTGTEVGDEESYYEVEVTKSDGSQVDVQLDKGFDVVGSAADHEDSGGADDDGGADR